MVQNDYVCSETTKKIGRLFIIRVNSLISGAVLEQKVKCSQHFFFVVVVVPGKKNPQLKGVPYMSRLISAIVSE